MSDDLEPVAVHIASVADGARPAGTPRRKRTSRYQTVTLQASDACQPVLPVSDKRKTAFILAVDQAVTINSNQSSAAAAMGTYVPQGIVWPVEDDSAVYAFAAGLAGTTTARVSVEAVYEE
jgi:hypothetical protein